MNGEILTVSHQKGGVGKSTFCANLAVQLAKKHKTSIIDLDVQKSLSYFLNTREEDDINLLNTPQNAQELMRVMDNHKKGVLVIDTGGYDFDMARIAMLGSDFIITPVSDSPLELHGLSVFATTLESLKEAKKDIKAMILFNRVHPFSHKSIIELREDIQKIQVFETFRTVLRDRKIYKEAFFHGKSVVEFGDGTPGANEFKLLMHEINLRLQK